MYGLIILCPRRLLESLRTVCQWTPLRAALGRLVERLGRRPDVRRCFRRGGQIRTERSSEKLKMASELRYTWGVRNNTVLSEWILRFLFFFLTCLYFKVLQSSSSASFVSLFSGKYSISSSSCYLFLQLREISRPLHQKEQIVGHYMSHSGGFI